jgi:hypothetical protein
MNNPRLVLRVCARLREMDATGCHPPSHPDRALLLDCLLELGHDPIYEAAVKAMGYVPVEAVSTPSTACDCIPPSNLVFHCPETQTPCPCESLCSEIGPCYPLPQRITEDEWRDLGRPNGDDTYTGTFGC